MIKNHITRRLLDEGKINSVGLIILTVNHEYATFKCKLSKVIKNGDDIILKLKTGKDYPLGHKYIFRSLEEVI